MAAAEGFAQGLQGGLGMFNAMQNAAYQQQMLQNADENQAQQKRAFEEQKAQHAAIQYQNEFTRDEFVLKNQDKLGEDMVLPAYNRMNKRMGGTHPVNQLEVDTFRTDSTKYLSGVKGAGTDEEANKLIDEYRARGATNPIMNNIAQGNIRLMEDARDRRNLMKEMEAMGIGNGQWRERFVGEGDPKHIRELIKNNDTRGMIQYQWAQDVMLAHEAGNLKDPHELSTAIGYLHTRAGGQLNKEGAKIFEPLNRAQFHQEAVGAYTETQQITKPLIAAAGAIKPDDVQALNDASNTTRTLAGDVYSALGLGGVKHENDAVAQTQEILKKYPQLTQQLQQIGPQAEQAEQVLQDQLAQLKRDKIAAKAAVTLPNRTEHLERLDYQIKIKQQELAPWHTVVTAYRSPESPEAIKGLLGLGGSLTKALDQNEELRVKNLTEGEQHARKTLERDNTILHHDKLGPAHVSNELFKWIGENPNSTDPERLAKAAELGKVYEKQTGYAADMNEVTKRVVAARTSTSDDTISKMTPEQATRFTMIQQGRENLHDYRTAITNPDGSYDMKLLMSQELRFPWSDGRTVDTIILDVQEGRLRTESGAAVPDNEVARMVKRARPLWTDNKETIDRKLNQMDRFYEVNEAVVDPSQKLRSRIPAAPQRTREDILGSGKIDAPVASDGLPINIAPSDPKLGVGAYHEWRKKNPKAAPTQFLQAQGK